MTLLEAPEVLGGAVEDYTANARALTIGEATVKAHVSKILKKLKVHSRNRAIALFAPRAAE